MKMGEEMIKKYGKSLANTPGPASLDDIPKVKIDYNKRGKRSGISTQS